MEFETSEEAQKALKHMDGGRPEYLFQCVVASFLYMCYITFFVDVLTIGQIDGQEITASAVLTQRVRPPPRRPSPPRRMPPPPPMWRRSPPRMRRR